MRQPPVLVESHGFMVYENPTIEAIRRDECLCLNCGRFKPGTDEHCRIAALLFAVCRIGGVTTPVSRCPDWIKPEEA